MPVQDTFKCVHCKAIHVRNSIYCSKECKEKFLAEIAGEPCTHENQRVIPYNFGRCSETGYQDEGYKVVCRDCGEVLEVA